MLRLAGIAILLAFVAPALGQGMDFQQLLSGKEFPHNLKLKELNADWRHLSIGTTEAGKGGLSDSLGPLVQAGMMSDMGKGKGKGDAAATMLGMSMLSGLFGGGESKQPVYYTKGQTVTVGSETFLVAYRYQKPELNLLQMAMQADKGGKEPDFSKIGAEGKLTPDSPLTIALINVKTISTLNNIRPFNLDQEIAESAQGGGLMDLIAQEAAREASGTKQTPRPVSRPVAPRKPVARPGARP